MYVLHAALDTHASHSNVSSPYLNRAALLSSKYSVPSSSLTVTVDPSLASSALTLEMPTEADAAEAFSCL